MKSYKIMGWLIPTVLLVGFIVVMFLLFTAKVEEKGQDITEERVVMTGEEYALRIEKELTAVESSVEYAVDMYEKYNGYANIKKTLMNIVCKNSSAYMGVLADEKGTGISQVGLTVKLGGSPYFYHSKNGNHWFYAKDDVITGREALIYTMAAADGHYILAYYDVDDLFKKVKINDYKDVAFFVLMNENYDILASFGENDAYFSEGNIKDVIVQNPSTENKQAVKNMGIDVKNRQSGSQVVTVEGDTRSLCYAPLSAGDFYFLIGVEHNYIANEGNKYFEEAINMIVSLIIAIGIFFLLVIIINMMTNIVDKNQKSELKQKADTDLLTGLTNKAATIRQIKEYIAQNPGGMGVLFIIDIDNFKKINDTMGHAFGDEVLKELGHQLRGMFRAMDVVGRFGGDEFIVFMWDVKEATAIKKNADRLRDFFRNFKAGEYVKYSVTASVGAAVYSSDGKDFETLFQAADKAAYMVKKKGKNDLAFYEDVKDEDETQFVDYKGRED